MKIGFISGGWDLMHYNHVKTLNMVKKQCDKLIVNVLSDERMIKKKGPNRPLIPLKERMYIVSNIRCVDEVMSIPGEDYPIFKAIDQVEPDFIFINIDEQPDISKEVEYCKGKRTKIVPIHRIDDGISTTKLIETFKTL